MVYVVDGGAGDYGAAAQLLQGENWGYKGRSESVIRAGVSVGQRYRDKWRGTARCTRPDQIQTQTQTDRQTDADREPHASFKRLEYSKRNSSSLKAINAMHAKYEDISGKKYTNRCDWMRRGPETVTIR